MSERVVASQLADSIRTLASYVDDLARVGFDGAATKLRLVVNCAQKDASVRPLAELLRTRLGSGAFLERAMRTPVDLPSSALDRFAFQYDLLLHLKMGWKLNLRELLSRGEFAPGGMDERWKAFQARLIVPFHQALVALQRTLEAGVGGGAGIEPRDAYAEALRIVCGEDPATSGEALVPAPSPAPSLGGPQPDSGRGGDDRRVSEEVQAANLTKAEEADLLLDAQLLALELRKHAPSEAQLATLLEGFDAAGERIGAAARAAVAHAGVELPGLTTTHSAQVALEPPSAGGPGQAPQVEADEVPSVRSVLKPSEDLAVHAQRLQAERQELEQARSAFARERAAFEAERRAFYAERGAAKPSAKKAAKPAAKKAAKPAVKKASKPAAKKASKPAAKKAAKPAAKKAAKPAAKKAAKPAAKKAAKPATKKAKAKASKTIRKSAGKKTR